MTFQSRTGLQMPCLQPARKNARGFLLKTVGPPLALLLEILPATHLIWIYSRPTQPPERLVHLSLLTNQIHLKQKKLNLDQAIPCRFQEGNELQSAGFYKVD